MREREDDPDFHLFVFDIHNDSFLPYTYMIRRLRHTTMSRYNNNVWNSAVAFRDV